jgi:ferredoxin
MMEETFMSWRVAVDRGRCMGTGACVHARPEVFALGDDGTAEVIGPVDGQDAFLRDVIDECPTAALRLVPGNEW